MTRIANHLRGRRPLAFMVSLAAGLALALAVGAVASGRQADGPAAAKQSLVSSDARLAMRPDRAAMWVFARPATPGDTVPASMWAPDVYGGGCTAGFAPGAHAVYLRGFSNGQTWVWGILRNDVINVDAVVNGQAVPVTLAQSAFFYQGSALPDSLQLTLNDGSIIGLPLSAAPTIQ